MAKKTTKKSKVESALTFQFGSSFNRAYKSFHIAPTQLRNLARANPFVAIAINKVIEKVTKVDFIIRSKVEKDKDKYPEQIDFVKNLLAHPNQNNDTFRSILTKMLRDCLIMDQGVIEKVKNIKGEVVELYHVDGATIKPNFDQYGLFKDPAYVQFFPDAYNATFNSDTDPDQTFDQDTFLIFQKNPQGDAANYGHGISPVEMVATTIIAGLQAMMYNTTIFDESHIPDLLVNMKGVRSDDLVKFKNEFDAQLAGKMHANSFTNAEELTVQQLKPNNQEMQFYELNLWLARTTISAFGLSGEEFGLTMDSNRAISQTQHKMSKDAGVEPYLDLIAEEINTDLLGDLAKIDPAYNELEFAWDKLDDTDKLTQAQIDQINIGIKTRTVDELRQRDGLDPMTPEQLTSIQQNAPQPFAPTTMQAKNEETTKSYNKWIEFYQ